MLNRSAFRLVLLVCLVLTGIPPVPADLLNVPAVTAEPEWSPSGMVSTQDAIATRVGVDILKRGGNAVDAAVAVGFTLAVTLPQAGNLGGGGFMLVHMAEANETVAIDYREQAPAAAFRDMFLFHDGQVDSNRSRHHGLAVGVPGTVKGLIEAHKRYGVLPFAEVIGPAIGLAASGFRLGHQLAISLQEAGERLRRNPAAADIFYQADGSPFKAGETLLQLDLAHTLHQIARHGADGFYQGPVAQRLVAAVHKAGGSMTLQDLRDYQVRVREPVRGLYRGHPIASMPPPSSGGVHIIQMLNMMEPYAIGEMGHNSADNMHILAEIMRRAYADRSEYLGDPDFYPVPVNRLIHKDYAVDRARSIDPFAVSDSRDIRPGLEPPHESPQTTHYSVVDRWGNAVSNTYTLNFSYGAGIVAGGTGVLLNNEMDDFSAKPGAPNAYGLIGGQANAIEPRKRPLSSMSPTIVFNAENNGVLLVTGSPGGSRIITTTLQIISNVIDHGMNIAEATEAPRFHHQWLPDQLQVEKGISIDTLRLLQKKGHSVEYTTWPMGSTQSILRGADGWTGASDPRQSGSLAAGY
jgi:gamma-glutamyltranspeptidase/glutathione hydrolase